MITRSTAVATNLEGPIHRIVFSPKGVLVHSHATDELSLFENESPVELHFEEYLGHEKGIHYNAGFSNADYSEDSRFRLVNLRGSYKSIPADLFRIAGYASEVISWRRNFQFCGACGTKTERVPHERAMKCTSCGLMAYPRISPAIIVAITKGDSILLAHNIHFPENQYSTLAGFIDPGESAEEAVDREIFEEVGIKVKNIRYVSSQPWPFPDSLMLGYTAEYDAGEIVPDGVEITDARWFTKEDLVNVTIPGKQAVARTLIETVFGPIDRD